MLHSDREIDIIVYGATGFTGKIACRYLKERYMENCSSSEKIRLAIGGRSKEKLEKVKSELGFKNDDLQVFVADSMDRKELDDMCQKTKVVITFVGPYAAYGGELVAACVNNETHYVDLTGETFWASQQIAKWENKARQTKTILIFSCGYDSVPSDLNTMLAVKELKEVGGQDIQVGTVTSGARAKGGVSGGTIASFLGMYDSGLSVLRKLRSAYILSPVKGIQKRTGHWVTQEADLTGGFFIMAPHNGAVVRRTWGLLEASSNEAIHEQRYGKHFSYDEYLVTPGYITAFLVTFLFRIIGLVFLIPQVRTLMRKYGPQSGQGPSERTQEAGWFEHITTAHSVQDDVQVRVTMHGTRDPGYGWTARCISECAVTLVKSHEELPPLAQEGGFLTPATGMGDALLKRLESSNLVKVEKKVLRMNAKKTL